MTTAHSRSKNTLHLTRMFSWFNQHKRPFKTTLLETPLVAQNSPSAPNSSQSCTNRAEGKQHKRCDTLLRIVSDIPLPFVGKRWPTPWRLMEAHPFAGKRNAGNRQHCSVNNTSVYEKPTAFTYLLLPAAPVCLSVCLRMVMFSLCEMVSD